MEGGAGVSVGALGHDPRLLGPRELIPRTECLHKTPQGFHPVQKGTPSSLAPHNLLMKERDRSSFDLKTQFSNHKK